MNDVQLALLDLLKEIDDICRSHNITYYIDGGTALGAVRHRGFLPWDDDADIMMTRSNYEAFKKAVAEVNHPGRALEDLHTTPDYTMVYGRYCNTDTTCILRTSMLDQFQSGLFIDIFILDPIPDTPESRKEYFEILHGYCEYLNPFYYDEIISTNQWYDRFCKMGAEKGRDAVIEYVERHLFSYPDTEGMTYGFRYDNGKWIYPRDVVGTPRYVDVEGVMLPVAEKVEDYLRIHYGDHWNMIPPPAEEETHNVVIDLQVPYRTFADSYMPHINRTKAINTYKKLHALRIVHRRATTDVDTMNYRMAAELYARTLTQKLKQKKLSFPTMISRGEYDQIRSLLDNYYDMQLHRWFMYYRVFVPVTDAQLYGALYLMLIDGLYSKADKILNLRREQGEPLSKELVQIENLIEDIRKCVRCFEVNDLAGALHICEQRLKGHPDVVNFAEGAIRARAMMALKDNVRARADEVYMLAGKYSMDVRDRSWVRASLDMLKVRFCTGDEQENARCALVQLMENDSDGMLRLAVKDFLAAENDQ